MKPLVVLGAFLTVAALLCAGAAPLGGGVPVAVHYITHDNISALLAKGELSAMVNDPGLTVAVNRRGAGPPEYHEHTNHIIIVIDEATFVTGGAMIGTKPTARDHITAASIAGGQTYHLSKGDIITIPAKTPHWFKDVSAKTISYYLINIQSQ